MTGQEKTFSEVFKMSKIEFKELVEDEQLKFELSKSALKKLTKPIKKELGFDKIKEIIITIDCEDSKHRIQLLMYPKNEEDYKKAEKHKSYPTLSIYSHKYFKAFRTISNFTTAGEIMYYVSDNISHQNTENISQLFTVLDNMISQIYPKKQKSIVKKERQLPCLLSFLKQNKSQI